MTDKRPKPSGAVGRAYHLRVVKVKNDHIARLERCVRAAREYQSEYLNPMPDFMLRALLRTKLFQELDAARAEVGEIGGGDEPNG